MQKKLRMILSAALLAAVFCTSAVSAAEQTSKAEQASQAGQASKTEEVAGTEAASGAGKSVQKGWKRIGGKKYYIKANGEHKTGWFNYNNHRFYLNPKEDGAAVTGIKRINGKTYCFNEKGRMLKNRRAYQIGENYYAVDSKGTPRKLSAVEKQAVELLKTFSGSKVRAAFDWAAKLPYQSISTAGKTPRYFASYGFTYKKGDCNVQACAFYCMAKTLGYDAHYVTGFVPQTNGLRGKHAWVEIDLNGTTYVFDPNLAGRYASVYGKNTGWKFRYGAKHTYVYQDMKRVN